MHDPAAAAALAGLVRGCSVMAGLLSRTLGPAPGLVLSAVGRGAPEVLEDSATVARRVTGLTGRRENSGAMLVREMAQTVQQRSGDGATTAVVLGHAMVAGAARAVVAGANPVLVKRGVERGVAAAAAMLAERAAPVTGPEELVRLATGATGDPELGEMLGELYDVLGDQADIVISGRVTPGLDREYVAGARWTARPAYRELVPEGTAQLTFRDPLVVTVDQALTVDAVRAAVEVGHVEQQVVLVVAREVDEEARRLLVRNRFAADGPMVAAMIPGSSRRRISADLDDVSVLTGSVLLADETGCSPEALRVQHCGGARTAVLTRRRLELVGGRGDPSRIAQRIAQLAAQEAALDRGGDEWSKVNSRAARLRGSVGVLVIGARADHERELAKRRVTKARRVLELAMTNGIVAGGGVAFLQCVTAVLGVRERCAFADERWGIDVVAAALEAPFRQLVSNHSTTEPGVALHRVRELGEDWGFDVCAGVYVPMAKAGVVDSADVLRGALEAAGSLAATVVTVGGVVAAKG